MIKVNYNAFRDTAHTVSMGNDPCVWFTCLWRGLGDAAGGVLTNLFLCSALCVAAEASEMATEIVNAELRHQLEINLQEQDPELGMLFRPENLFSDTYFEVAQESPLRLVESKRWLLSEGNTMLAETVMYAEARVMAGKAPMQYFYESREFSWLEEIVTRVAVAVRLQGFEEIDREDEQQLASCLDKDEVMKLLACYAFFICLANRHFGPSRYDEIFTKLWWSFYGNFVNEMCNFWERAELWREDWKGCLFFEI